MKIEIPENTAFAFSAVDPETIQNLEDEYTLVSIAEEIGRASCRERV